MLLSIRIIRINRYILSVILVFLSPPKPPETHTLTSTRRTMLAAVMTPRQRSSIDIGKTNANKASLCYSTISKPKSTFPPSLNLFSSQVPYYKVRSVEPIMSNDKLLTSTESLNNSIYASLFASMTHRSGSLCR